MDTPAFDIVFLRQVRCAAASSGIGLQSVVSLPHGRDAPEAPVPVVASTTVCSPDPPPPVPICDPREGQVGLLARPGLRGCD
eukprot:5322735-Alexandrium_andersonii.AAC.1